MSRDWTPQMIHESTKIYPDLANLTDTLMIQVEGEYKPLYSDEQKELAHKYPNLGIFGFDFLMDCRKLGVFKVELGHQIVQLIEDIFSNGSIDDKELYDVTMKWYKGELANAYYMEENNLEFAKYVKDRIKLLEET